MDEMRMKGRMLMRGPAGKPGQPGRDGVSILTAQVNAAGRLIITLSNGDKIDAGVVNTGGGGGGGVDFTTDETLTLENGVLSVNTAKAVEADNTLPITSAAVAVTVGNIEVLLEII